MHRFLHKGALVAYAGVNAPPYQSGMSDAKNRHVSECGSPRLRKVLFEIATMTPYCRESSDLQILF